MGFLYFYKYSVCFVSGVPYLLGADLYCAPFPPLQLSANWKTEGFYYKITRTLNKNEDFLYICDNLLTKYFFPMPVSLFWHKLFLHYMLLHQFKWYLSFRSWRKSSGRNLKQNILLNTCPHLSQDNLLPGDL